MNSARWRCRSADFEAHYRLASPIAGLASQGDFKPLSGVPTNRFTPRPRFNSIRD